MQRHGSISRIGISRIGRMRLSLTSSPSARAPTIVGGVLRASPERKTTHRRGLRWVWRAPIQGRMLVRPLLRFPSRVAPTRSKLYSAAAMPTTDSISVTNLRATVSSIAL